MTNTTKTIEHSSVLKTTRLGGEGSLSGHVLVLFLGPKDRPDGLMTFLRRPGVTVTAVDLAYDSGIFFSVLGS